ncbi:MAG TPA: hypothetical protein VJ925_05310 [Longimicrobiales bacterium]|nr:hypothetical protein [Longimicrobiales bacterium]
MTERRYDEDEVREIFDAASKAVERRTSEGSRDRLSLDDLKRIGDEVGLSPARIEEAARALDHAPSGARVDRDFGLPVGVGRTVDLPREPTDQEWERLVSLLRRTFKAKGKLDPTTRYWWNGNLTVGVEPTADGHQLRLTTTKGDARPLTRIGAGSILLAAGSWAVTAVMGLPPEMGLIPPIVGGYGVLALGANAFRLPGWARRRSEQMELVARRAVDMLLEAPSDDA